MMRYELKHDKLAAQIFVRASAAAKARRRAAEVYVLYAEKNRLLTIEELEDLAPFLPVLSPPPELQQLMERSRDSIREKEAAEKVRLERELQEKQGLLEQSQKQRKRASAFAVAGLVLAAIALMASIYALNQANKADKALVDVVRATLGEAERYILQLDYANALIKIQKAANLNAAKPEVGNSLLELAFWHAETENFPRATALLDSAALYLGKSIASKGLTTTTEQLELKKRFRSLIGELRPEKLNALMERYYPVEANMVRVGEGKFNREGVDVSISAIHLSKTEVTYWQWGLYCAAKKQEMEKPGWGSEGDNPAVLVSWYDAVDYCNWVSTQLGFDQVYNIDTTVQIDWNAKGFRLPTEAEWEYAARGGPKQQTFEYSGSNDLNEVGWYDKNSGSRTRPIASKKANSLGLFDMSGNVSEWCWDWYGETFESNQNNNPKGPDKGSSRVYRGGSWGSSAILARVAYRYDLEPDYRDDVIGFRLARQQ